jgi:hydrogenase nickel incorporation protein HypB
VERVTVDQRILKRNDDYAAELRQLFTAQGLLVINMWSAPGAGKTTLLEQTLRRLNQEWRVGVIEGDLQTSIDADRIRGAGTPAYQINTSRCHLEAAMIQEAIAEFPIGELDLLIVENIGNMVCPASYDLGEDFRVMVYSTTEGAEKPKKYPKMFHRSDCVILNKIDLVPYTNVSLDELRQNVLDVSPRAQIFPVSCRTGEGLDGWVGWLREKIKARKKPCA